MSQSLDRGATCWKRGCDGPVVKVGIHVTENGRRFVITECHGCDSVALSLEVRVYV